MIESARYAESGSIIAVIDGVQMSVPDDMGNRHRQLLVEWEAEGNTIEPYVPPPPTQQEYANAIQAHVDATARARDYMDGVSLASYVASTNPTWAAEAAAFVSWRDIVWAYAYEQLDAVENGLREQPTVAGLVAELPAITWP
jgi:hypothetical protein